MDFGELVEHRDEFNIITNAQNNRARQQNMDDHNHELRGTNVGRMARFLSPEVREIVDGERKGKNGLSAMDMVLISAEYAHAFEVAERDIRGAQIKAGAFLDKVDAVIEKLQQEIDETLEQAVTLPNGKKAFMNERGEVYTEDGELVDQAIVDGIDWTDRPSLELREEQLRRMDKMQEFANEGSRLSLRLGDIDNELHDEDNPPDQDKVDALRDEAKEITKELEELDHGVDAISKHDVSHHVDSSPQVLAAITVLPPV
ncbi:hypothetical protein SAMN04488056_105250 [Cohaesibacter marisflavi]|uniref:Uncharacterized protein n=1 Tax=Cohaesibacter marisflavi TaxID=655353 RepID=A0A1I5GXS5_9HYPH|nr:hypothetical protein [Cohaesibacter marisflavi]SFO40795.1 hypothetical protein SAMN04488056_105250 [Cohaesibacter marisflavi]